MLCKSKSLHISRSIQYVQTETLIAYCKISKIKIKALRICRLPVTEDSLYKKGKVELTEICKSKKSRSYRFKPAFQEVIKASDALQNVLVA